MSDAIVWDDIHQRHHIFLRIKFLEPGVNDLQDLIPRLVPFINSRKCKILYKEGDKKYWRYSSVTATPDAVILFSNDLIAVEYKTRQKSMQKLPTMETWTEFIRLREVLQVIIAGYSIAQKEQKVTACILRFDNALILVTPLPDVIETIRQTIPVARELLKLRDSQPLFSSYLAKIAEHRIEQIFKGTKPDTEAQRKGRAAHAHFLR